MSRCPDLSLPHALVVATMSRLVSASPHRVVTIAGHLTGDKFLSRSSEVTLDAAPKSKDVKQSVAKLEGRSIVAARPGLAQLGSPRHYQVNLQVRYYARLVFTLLGTSSATEFIVECRCQTSL